MKYIKPKTEIVVLNLQTLLEQGPDMAVSTERKDQDAADGKSTGYVEDDEEEDFEISKWTMSLNTKTQKNSK